MNRFRAQALVRPTLTDAAGKTADTARALRRPSFHDVPLEVRLSARGHASGSGQRRLHRA